MSTLDYCLLLSYTGLDGSRGDRDYATEDWWAARLESNRLLKGPVKSVQIQLYFQGESILVWEKFRR